MATTHLLRGLKKRVRKRGRGVVVAGESCVRRGEWLVGA